MSFNQPSVLGGDITAGEINLPDNAELEFGTGDDAVIVYDGTNFRINPKVVGNGKLRMTAGDIALIDSALVLFGTGDDASITYDGTNMIIDPKVVGSGTLNIAGNIGAIETGVGFGKMKLIKSYTADTAEANTGTALDPSALINLDDDYSAIIIVGNLHETADDLANIELEIDNIVTGYGNWGYRFDGTTMTQITGISDNYQIASGSITVGSTSITFYAVLQLMLTGGGSTRSLTSTIDAHGDSTSRPCEHWTGTVVVTAGPGVTNIMVKADANWNAGTNISVYGVRR